MKLVVLGGATGFARRALEDLTRKKVVSEVIPLPASASVGDVVQAAREADAIVGGDLGALTSMRVPLAAIAAGKPAVVPSWSSADHRDHLDLDADAREVGIAVVTGASASPAIPIVLARHAARGLDEVRSVEIAWAMPPEALTDGGTVRALLEGMSHPALVRPDGTFSYTRPGRSVPTAFPEPVGICRAGTFGGAEAWRLCEMLPGTPSVRVSLGGTVSWWDLAMLLPARIARSVKREHSAQAVAHAVSRLGRIARDAGWAGVRVEVEGRGGATSETRVVGGFDRLEGWNAAALSLGVRMLLRDDVPRGVTVAGSLGSPAEALNAFHDSGIRFAAFEPAA